MTANPARGDLPGHAVTRTELEALGFLPLTLRMRSGDVILAEGTGCEWDTITEVPDAPGVYLFTVEETPLLCVTYAGLTEQLWMVTKGRLPKGGARGGQRYGRPRHAGVTRQRVNTLIAEQVRKGRVVAHWVRPFGGSAANPAELRAALASEEGALIQRWRLRQVGWNRG